jgi:DNA invertase Pin-like site-specific DNA recombinase
MCGTLCEVLSPRRGLRQHQVQIDRVGSWEIPRLPHGSGCQAIRKEKASGTTTKGRAELATFLDFIREGDTLVVTRIDRLARSIADLQDIVRTLQARGAALRATEQPIDTSTAAGKCFLDMLGVFAEFETNLRRERQLEGIAKAKAAGVYKGRKPSINMAHIEALKASGLGPT